jgi:hypothetical protein
MLSLILKLRFSELYMQYSRFQTGSVSPKRCHREKTYRLEARSESDAGTVFAHMEKYCYSQCAALNPTPASTYNHQFLEILQKSLLVLIAYTHFPFEPCFQVFPVDFFQLFLWIEGNWVGAGLGRLMFAHFQHSILVERGLRGSDKPMTRE